MRDLVEKYIDGIGNIMALQSDASMAYDNLRWAIEAKEDEHNGKVTYLFRKFEDKNEPGPGFIKLKDGDEIRFGQGEGKDFEGFLGGPIPALCNLHHAVARVSYMSGAADLVTQLYADAAFNFPIDLTRTDFANILTPKLLNPPPNRDWD